MITGSVTGDREILLRWKSASPAFQEALVRGVGRATLMLLAAVKDRLSDQVLRVRTGRLRRSINQKVTQENGTVIGSVGTNVTYGKVHEFGFQGVVNVRSHLRTIRRTGRAAMVRAHTRNARYPERSFLRATLRDLSPMLQAEIEAQIQRVNRTL